jgi:hypothetical protein
MIHVNKRSCRGHRYIALFVEKATSMALVQLMKHKDDFFNIFKVMIEEKGSNGLSNIYQYYCPVDSTQKYHMGWT